MGKSQRSLRITIDNHPHLVDPGTTVLDAARSLGLSIPTLCHLDQCKPPASCMVCLVKDVKTGASLPSCATEVVDGMCVESETAEVHALRRTAIELLLSDHVGDCLAPCTLACPLHVDFPTLVRLVRENKLTEAATLLRRQIPMTGLLERLCSKPCEKACRRGQYDRSVSVSTIHQTLATELAPSGKLAPSLVTGSIPENRSQVAELTRFPKGTTVAIVGGGMTGLTAAHFLCDAGYNVTIFEKSDQPGGRLREEIVLASLPDELLHDEIERLRRRGVVFELRTPIGPESLEKLLDQFAAVLVASGMASKNLFGESLQHTACFTSDADTESELPILRRAVSGRDAALAIDRFLTASANDSSVESTFSVRLGKLSEVEMNLFVEGVADIEPGDMPTGLGEAARCFLCDCTGLTGCELRRVAIMYDADPRRYKVPRRELVRTHTASGIVFESGKCIRCGRCIELLKTDPDAAGLTFVGRGFDVILSTPFGKTLDESLGRMAVACCEACPTGALVLRDQSATS